MSLILLEFDDKRHLRGILFSDMTNNKLKRDSLHLNETLHHVFYALFFIVKIKHISQRSIR